MKKIENYNKRVFVLGAGSSASYGFPTGVDLKRILLSKSSQEFYQSVSYYGKESEYYLNQVSVSAFYSYLNSIFVNMNGKRYCEFNLKEDSTDNRRIKITEDVLMDFRDKFSRSGTMTIDSFVSQASDSKCENVAKVLVMLVIRAFSTDEIFKPNPVDDWIEYYMYRSIDWNESFEDELPAVISFNYDNLFRIKLFHYLEQLKGQQEATRIIEKIPFIHIYGHLDNSSYGDLDLDEDKGLQLRTFLEKNFSNIKFIRGIDKEGIDLTSRFEIAEELEYKTEDELLPIFMNAEELYILGYGFDKFNNRLLFKDESNFVKIVREKLTSVTGYKIPDFIKNKLVKIKYPHHHDSYPKSFIKEGAKCRETLVSSMKQELFPV